MNSAFQAFAGLLDQGGHAITLPLLFVCAAMWVVILERARALGEAPWEAFLPPPARRQAAARLAFSQAFRAYLADPGDRTRAALLSRSAALHTPEGLFVRRAFAGATDPAGFPRPSLIDAAAYLGEREAWFGIGFVRGLVCASFLLGVLAATGGLAGTLEALAASGARDEAAWSEGLGRALAGSQVAAGVALPGMAAGAWLSHRASRLARQVRSRRVQLHAAAGAMEAAG